MCNAFTKKLDNNSFGKQLDAWIDDKPQIIKHIQPQVLSELRAMLEHMFRAVSLDNDQKLMDEFRAQLLSSGSIKGVKDYQTKKQYYLGHTDEVINRIFVDQKASKEYNFYASQKLEQNKVRQFVNTDMGCFEDFTFVYSLLKQH